MYYTISDALISIYPFAAFIATAILWIWSLADIVRRDQLENKAIWLTLIVGLPVIGALGYLIGGRPKTKHKQADEPR